MAGDIRDFQWATPSMFSEDWSLASVVFGIPFLSEEQRSRLRVLANADPEPPIGAGH